MSPAHVPEPSAGARRTAAPRTMQELAALAGIPRVTISRVINGYPHVSTRMRERVREALNRFEYAPSLLATGLAKQRSSLLALVIPDVRASFYSGMMDRLERQAWAQGLNLLSFNTFFDPAREKRMLALAARLRVAALILTPITEQGRLVNGDALRHVQAPVVFFDRYKDRRHSCVLLDNRAAGRLAAAHLLGLGHRRVAVLGSPEDPANVCVRDRCGGFRQALQRRGLRADASCVWTIPWSEQSFTPTYGYELAKACLPRLRAEGVTGLFAYTDSIAAGALRALAEAGLRVPGDVSLVGCDDLDFAAFTSPPLTTIRQPMAELVDCLLRAAAPTHARHVQEEIAPALVERSSAAPPQERTARGRR